MESVHRRPVLQGEFNVMRGSARNFLHTIETAVSVQSYRVLTPEGDLVNSSHSGADLAFDVQYIILPFDTDLDAVPDHSTASRAIRRSSRRSALVESNRRGERPRGNQRSITQIPLHDSAKSACFRLNVDAGGAGAAAARGGGAVPDDGALRERARAAGLAARPPGRPRGDADAPRLRRLHATRTKPGSGARARARAHARPRRTGRRLPWEGPGGDAQALRPHQLPRAEDPRAAEGMGREGGGGRGDAAGAGPGYLRLLHMPAGPRPAPGALQQAACF
eukprot:345410-Prorocentrum_minimum.AAC.2